MGKNLIINGITSILILVFCTYEVTLAESKWKQIPAERNRIKLNVDKAEFPGMSHYIKSSWEGEYFYFGNNFVSYAGHQNIMKLWYYELVGMHYPDSLDLNNALSTFKMFKTRSNLTINRGQLESGEIAHFSYIIFTTDNVPCALLSSTWGMGFHMGTSEGNERLNVVWCKKEGKSISVKELNTLVESIGIRDSFDAQKGLFTIKTNTSSKIQNNRNKPTSNIPRISTTEKETKLKEAKDLFDRDLITERQYDKLVNKILGLN